MGLLTSNAERDAIKQIAKEKRIDIFELISDDMFSKIPCYYDKNKNIFLYNKIEKKWILGDETDLINIAKFVIGEDKCNNPSFRKPLLNAIKDKARWKKPKEVSKNWIQFENCFYDIKDLKKIDIESEYFNQIKIPHKLGVNTSTPIIDKHIISWVGKEQYDLFVQICAYSMLKDYPFARFFIFYGTGQDGKSTAGDFISKLVGNNNTCNIDIDNLNTNRFESQKLYQKTLAICGEIDYKLLKNTKKLKGITGNDPMTIEFKNKNPFNYYNFAKLIWFANGLPPTYDKTQGFYRRTIVLKFPNKFKEKTNPLSNISEEEYENFCLKCMYYLRHLLEYCFFEKSIKEKEQEYEDLSNPVIKFLSSNVFESYDDDFILASELYASYLKFAKIKGYRGFNSRDFYAMVEAEDYKIVKTRLFLRVGEGSEVLDYHKKPGIFYDPKDIRRRCLLHYNLGNSGNSGNPEITRICYKGGISKNRVPNGSQVPKTLLDNPLILKDNPLIQAILNIMNDYKEYTIMDLSRYCEIESKLLHKPISYLLQNGEIFEPKPQIYVKTR